MTRRRKLPGFRPVPPKAEPRTSIIKNRWFPKASGLWRVQGGALALLSWIYRQPGRRRLSNEPNPGADDGDRYCRGSGLVQYTQGSLNVPATPGHDRHWRHPSILRAMRYRALLRGRAFHPKEMALGVESLERRQRSAKPVARPLRHSQHQRGGTHRRRAGC
jgi:hypothetical protein